MELFLLNIKSGLQPLYPEDYQEKKKLKLNEKYKAKITLARNIKFHRKFFKLIQIGHENSKSVDLPFEAYRALAIMRAGFFETYATGKGTMILPQSIAFDKMDDAKFSEVYNRVLDFIIKDTQATKEDIEKVLIDFM